MNLRLRERALRTRVVSAGDDIRERRLEELRDTVEQFTFSLGLLLAGHDPEFGATATPELRARLEAAVEPFLASGDAMRPDFGAYGELHVEGDLLLHDQPVTALLEFDDRSMRETADGRLLPAPRRRIRLELRLSIQPCRIEDCAIHLLAAGR